MGVRQSCARSRNITAALETRPITRWGLLPVAPVLPLCPQRYAETAREMHAPEQHIKAEDGAGPVWGLWHVLQQFNLHTRNCRQFSLNVLRRDGAGQSNCRYRAAGCPFVEEKHYKRWYKIPGRCHAQSSRLLRSPVDRAYVRGILRGRPLTRNLQPSPLIVVDRDKRMALQAPLRHLLFSGLFSTGHFPKQRYVQRQPFTTVGRRLISPGKLAGTLPNP